MIHKLICFELIILWICIKNENSRKLNGFINDSFIEDIAAR